MPAVAAFGIATAAAVGFAIFLVAKPLNHIAPSFLGQG
jgi:preprotein translocase subunit Sss1